MVTLPGDPDGLYWVSDRVELESRVQLYSHERQWFEAIAGYNGMLQSGSTLSEQSYVDGTGGAARNRPHIGMLKSLQHLGLGSVAQVISHCHHPVINPTIMHMPRNPP